MRNRLSIYALGLLLLTAMVSVAQEYPKIAVPVGFSFVNVRPQVAGITSFNVFGGGGGFVYNLSPLIGIKADFMGYTQSSGHGITENGQVVGNVSGNLFTYLFGPQIKKHSGKFQPFGAALFGAAHTNLYANVCTLEGVCGSGSGNNNGFSMQYGLGLDILITSLFSSVLSKWTIYIPTLAPTTFQTHRAARTTSSISPISTSRSADSDRPFSEGGAGKLRPILLVMQCKT